MCWALKKCWYRINQKILKLGLCFMNWKEPTVFDGEGAVLQLPAFIKEKGINRVLISYVFEKALNLGLKSM